MPFTNLPVDTGLLPQAASLELKPMPGSYRRLLHLQWWLSALFLYGCLTALFGLNPDWRSVPALAASSGSIALLLLAWYLSIELGWRWRGYALRTHDLVYRHGWIFRSMQVCPFNRVQNCSLNRGPLDRRFGLATLVLFTAGSDGADLKLRGLPVSEAENIRQFFLERIHEDAGSH